MSERLEDIKKNATGIFSQATGEVDGVDLSVEDYKWLIEQAERVNILEKREEVRKLSAIANNEYYRGIEQENEQLKAKIKRLQLQIGREMD